MKERVTKVRKKTVNGFSDPIPIGAKAQNITLSNGTILQDVLDVLQDGQAGHEVLTQVEYDSLPISQKNNGTVYFIEDGVDDNNRTLASIIGYNNNSSNLNATNVQDAIDELKLNQPRVNELEWKEQSHSYSVSVSSSDGSTNEALLKAAIGKGLISFYNDFLSHYSGIFEEYNKYEIILSITGSLTDTLFCSVYVYTSGSNFLIRASSQKFGMIIGRFVLNTTVSPITYSVLDSEFRIEAPVTFDNTINSIKYRGTNATYDMIKFIDNINDTYGNGIAIGGGGPTIIGGGESTTVILNDTINYPQSGGQENMIIANDNGISFFSNVQNGTSEIKKMTYDGNGNLLVNGGGGVYIGLNKTSQYGTSGVMLHPQGYICLANSSTISSRGGIYFAWNNANNPTAHIREISSGRLEISNNVLIPNTLCIGSNKAAAYTQQGLWLGSNGNITLTGGSGNVGCSVNFAYNGSSSATSWIKESSSGNIQISNSLSTVGGITAGGNVYAIGSGEHYCESRNITTGLRMLFTVATGPHAGIWTNGYHTGSSLISWSSSNTASDEARFLIKQDANGLVKVRFKNRAAGTAKFESRPIICSANGATNIENIQFGTSGYSQYIIFSGIGSGNGNIVEVKGDFLSDPRLKENIEISNIKALQLINKIPFYSFDWKKNKQHWNIGFIAPELYKIDQNLVNVPNNEKEYWKIDNYYLAGLQTKAIQQLSEQNEKLKAKVDILEQRLAKIEALLKDKGN